MADIHPFRALRYDVGRVGDLSDVVAPPYDVINEEMQTELYEKHPCNVVRLILNRTEPGDAGPDDKYERAATFLHRWTKDGVLSRDREEALYVYHQEFDWGGRHFVRKGFMCRIRLEEFGEGKIYPHEQTMSGPKADRLALTKACRANLSPIFGLFPDSDQAAQSPLEAAIVESTPVEATDHLGVIHRLWVVTDRAAINAAREVLRESPVFIADGHHRYETALNYRRHLAESGKLGDENDPANFVLMMLVGMSDPGLAILPTHRLVSGLPDITSEQLIAALGDYFEIEAVGTGAAAMQECWDLIDADGGQDVFGFGTTADDKWVFARLTDGSLMAQLAPDQSPAWRELGVSVLRNLVLEHQLKNNIAGADPQCTYVRLLEEVSEAQKAGTCQVACLVPPAGMDHIREIAGNFEKMPAKSTYFYPKLLSGLLINPLDQ